MIPDCACVIHGDAYAWSYVDNLLIMLRRHLHKDVRLHVFTESWRDVPEPYVRHDLVVWPQAQGPRGAWWNKLQLFGPGHFSGPVIYFDLDVVLVDDIRWLQDLDTQYFWAIRDWRWLWKANWTGINSSVMYWNAPDWTWIWDRVQEQGLDKIRSRHPGDQDWLTETVALTHRRFFEQQRIQSWRWQVHDGGMDMHTRRYRRPGAGAVIPPDTSIVVFHGRPKPHQIELPWIRRHWPGPTPVAA